MATSRGPGLEAARVPHVPRRFGVGQTHPMHSPAMTERDHRYRGQGMGGGLSKREGLM
jgi:hypothetical protein